MIEHLKLVSVGAAGGVAISCSGDRIALTAYFPLTQGMAGGADAPFFLSVRAAGGVAISCSGDRIALTAYFPLTQGRAASAIQLATVDSKEESIALLRVHSAGEALFTDTDRRTVVIDDSHPFTRSAISADRQILDVVCPPQLWGVT